MDSALSQPTRDREVIVVDDASTDGSQEVLRQYGDTIRLHCLETNQGVGSVRNHGAALSRGEYLVHLDGDDALLPWSLGVYDRIIRDRSPKFILANMWWFKGCLPTIEAKDIPRKIEFFDYTDYLRRDRSFSKSVIRIVDRNSFDSVQGWGQDMWPMEDMNFHLRLCVSGRAVLIATPPTAFRRVHAANTVNNIPAFTPALCRMIQKEYGGDYPGGKGRRLERRAWIGGLVFFEVKRAIKASLYRNALKLLMHGWPMVLAAVALRLKQLAKGRRPCEVLEISPGV